MKRLLRLSSLLFLILAACAPNRGEQAGARVDGPASYHPAPPAATETTEAQASPPGGDWIGPNGYEKKAAGPASR